MAPANCLQDLVALLVTHVGVAKVMGAPFRPLCPGEGLERDFAWLLARVDEQAVGVAKLFAHIELKVIPDQSHSGNTGPRSPSHALWGRPSGCPTQHISSVAAVERSISELSALSALLGQRWN